MPKSKGYMAEVNVPEALALIGFVLMALQSFQIFNISILGTSLESMAPVLAMVFLLGGYVANEIRSFETLVDWEYLVIAITLFLLASVQWIPEIADFVLGSTIYSALATGITIVGFVVLCVRRE
ncbi:hypothetical protein C9439_02195 [archaeon SCG-AAA382B04]|nr:hypothetical protein C9439_02195 [archaeon SCG-AAA382B04]